MTVVRWIFFDPVTLEDYQLAVNPSEGGSPGYRKSFVYQNTAAPDGKVLVFEGRDEVQKMEFSGTLLTEEQFNAFVEWYEKRYQIQVTDDLGREFSIMIDSFEPTRQRAVNHPWKHTYRISATVVNWES